MERVTFLLPICVFAVIIVLKLRVDAKLRAPLKHFLLIHTLVAVASLVVANSIIVILCFLTPIFSGPLFLAWMKPRHKNTWKVVGVVTVFASLFSSYFSLFIYLQTLMAAVFLPFCFMALFSGTLMIDTILSRIKNRAKK